MFGIHQGRHVVLSKSEFTEMHRLLDARAGRVASVWRELDGSISVSQAQKNLRSLDAALQAAYSDITPDLEKRAVSDFTAGAKVGVDEANIVLSISTDVNPLAVEWAEKSTGSLIKEATKEQKAAVRRLVKDGLKAGENPRVIARSITQSIGLDTRASVAIQNYRRALVLADTKESRITSLVNKRYQRALKSRAETIARTEVMAALNQGQRNAWNVARAQGLLDDTTRRVWIPDPGTNHNVCLDLDETEVKLDKEFPLGDPPIHPRCVCTVGLVFG